MAMIPKLRHDLQFERHDDGRKAVTFVKDPIRSVFYELSDLQVAISEAFDGQRSFEEVAAVLELEHGVAVPIAKLQNFAAFLEKRLLLDITCYLNWPDVSKALRRQLKRVRLVLRPELESGPFQLAQRELLAREYAKAAAILNELSATLPRAKALFERLHVAFFSHFIELPSYMRMVHLWNPDRFLGWLDVRAGKVLFSRWGVLLFTLFLLSALRIIPELERPLELASMRWSHVLIAPFAVGLSTLFVHELGHGLACKHYGGKVESLGIMLFYWVVPGAYCDVTEVHKFRRRRDKVIVYLAGCLFEIPALCAWLWIHYLSADSMFLHQAILIWLAYDCYVILQNIVPLIKGYDGYYALTNYLDIPDLSERSFGYLRRLLAQYLFGVEATSALPGARERRIFLWFGLASVLANTVLIYALWFRLLFPLVLRYLGVPGLLLAIVYGYTVLGRKALRGLLSFARFLWLERRRIFVLRRSVVYSLVVAAPCLVLAMPASSYADGEFVARPEHLAHIRALEPGLIATLAVRDGSQVRRGDTLLTFDGAELEFEARKLAQDLARERTRLELVLHAHRPEEIAVARERLARDQGLARISEDLAQLMRPVRHIGVLSENASAAFEGAARENAGTAQVSARSLALLRAPAIAHDLDQVRALIEGIEKAQQLNAERRARLIVKSPLDGVVVGLRPELSWIFRRLERGDPICEIHDLSAIYAEITIPRGELTRRVAERDAVALRAWGEPERAASTTLQRVLSRTSPDGNLRGRTGEIPSTRWLSGMSGHARVYLPQRPLAAAWLLDPLLQLFDFSLWSIVH